MYELQGKYNKAVMYTDTADNETVGQIITMLSQPFAAESKICMMPDVHAGSGATVGTVMTVKGKTAPVLVGSDIGCGMETAVLAEKDIDLKALDGAVRNLIPAGRRSRESHHPFAERVKFNELRCLKNISVRWASRSMGTLGGGNHFIELDRGRDGKIYLVAHTGSRFFGKQVAEYYVKRAKAYYKEHQPELIRQGLHKIDINLAYVEGALFGDYINDMKLAQKFAELNRQAIIGDIVDALGLTVTEQFSTVHNYIDTERMILRKGAISAQSGERMLIPMNMRDGSLLCAGKGNPDWLFSAPHGAGRLMNRSTAKERLSMDDYREAMKCVYSTSVDQSTIDESPFVYKPMEEIMANIGDTADVLDILKPLYNFKAGSMGGQNDD
ncbi:MAG: RtcB family protein [Clostridiales bacterium]|jgi:RNA-splicing ligase RtcB|nr:RtcB family protein [Clostridiales bacterium]